MRKLIEECNRQLEHKKHIITTDEEDANERDYNVLKKYVLTEENFIIRDKESTEVYKIVKNYYKKILLRCPLYRLQLKKRCDLELPFKNFMKLELAQDNLGRANRLKIIKQPLNNPSILKGIRYVKLFALKRFMLSYLLYRFTTYQNSFKFREQIFPTNEECNLFKAFIKNQRGSKRISEVMAREEMLLDNMEKVGRRPRRSQYVDITIQNSLVNESEFLCEIIKLDHSDFGVLTLTENLLTFVSKKKDVNNEEYRLGPTTLMNICRKYKKVQRVLEVTKIMVKYYNMVRQAVEISLYNHKTLFIVFFSEIKLNDFLIAAKKVFHRIEIIEDPKRKFQSEKFIKDWKAKKISNFEYLMQLNNFSSRSFEVLSQYPVFPWVIKNFTEESFTYSEETFRNLQLPIAGISDKKRQEAQRKYEHTDDFPGGQFQHGSHYLPGLGVLCYLMRLQPYTLIHFKFNQGGDCPSRAFHSVATMWNNLNKQAGSNLEVVPEFYYNSEFLANMYLLIID